MAKMDRAQKLRMRVNVLCLAGAILSLACCLLAWTVSHAHTTKMGTEEIELTAPEFALGSTWADTYHSYLQQIPSWGSVVLGAQVFLIGIALSFVTPLGGFAQLAGIVLFRVSINDYVGSKQGVGPGIVSVSTSVNFAFYLSAVGALVVIMSLFFQFSPDFHRSTTKLKDRLLVYSMFRPQA